MTERVHHMPFGAEVMPDGRARFRLWAPDAGRVDLRLVADGASHDRPMAAADGWFSLIAEDTPPGTLYHFVIDGGLAVPDPASRYQPHDVHGPSALIDPRSWRWSDGAWYGRPWREAIIYELHVGAFTPEGSFRGVADRLDHLVDLGVTAIELMPLADFPGRCNWGYDGALLFAPDSRYGTPDDLKALIQSAHQKGLMVLLDVVYNHFGPEGNYLHTYNRSFFAQDRHTPWGAAINFGGENSHWVRRFFIDNALYWLEEYHFDGLRLDAVDTILDDSRPDILTELAQTVRTTLGNGRHIHLILENDGNSAARIGRNGAGEPPLYTAQWNDDFHHALHVLLTGERGGCYADYVERPLEHLGRCLSSGFAYRGEPSVYRNGRLRGEPCDHLPLSAFVSFLQNHDQIGNRPVGDRLSATLHDRRRLRLAIAIVLLSPSPPLLFMGEEWAASSPFPFFCDLADHLADNVLAGRLQGLSHFPECNGADAAERIPHPVSDKTFARAVLNWTEPTEPEHQAWLALYRTLIAIRHTEIIPFLDRFSGKQSSYFFPTEDLLSVQWLAGDGVRLNLLANCGDAVQSGIENPPGRLLFASENDAVDALAQGQLPPWTACWFLDR